MDEQEALARMRLAAQMTRNSSPPHCHPITILILILAAGTMFIGMTMTIVAHWPGSVSVGFDPLSIPGPIILTLGFVLFVVGSVLVCRFQRREAEKRGEKLVSFANNLSRLNLDSSQHNRSGAQVLEKEPAHGRNDKNGYWIDDYDEGDSVELERTFGRREGHQVRGQLDEVISSTTAAGVGRTPSLSLDDEEHLPFPVRTKKKIKTDASKVRVDVGTTKEINEETIEPLLASEVKTKSKTKKKKKKETKTNQTERTDGEVVQGGTRGDGEVSHEEGVKEEEEEEDDGSSRVFKVRVKTTRRTVVRIKHDADYEEDEGVAEATETGKRKP